MNHETIGNISVYSRYLYWSMDLGVDEVWFDIIRSNEVNQFKRPYKISNPTYQPTIIF